MVGGGKRLQKGGGLFDVRFAGRFSMSVAGPGWKKGPKDTKPLGSLKGHF